MSRLASMISEYDTIFALSTPAGGAIALIRVSGDMTRKAIASLFTGKLIHRRSSYGEIRFGGDLIDTCNVTFFESPHSYTGEDMAEIGVHGSHAVVEAVFDALTSLGLRRAEAGEFTKRAFLNGKLDLAQADAVMDMISSKAELSRKAAANQLEGDLSRRIGDIYERLTAAAALISATIDFPDEMDAITDSSAVIEELRKIRNELRDLANNGLRFSLLREGARVALVGRPNAGKSSLLNALIGKDRAIVTPIAGTTRDTIEAPASVCGIPVIFIDTAGVRSAADAIEAIGVQRTKAEIAKADLVLALFDGSSELMNEDIELLHIVSSCRILPVVTKADVFDMDSLKLDLSLLEKSICTDNEICKEAISSCDPVQRSSSYSHRSLPAPIFISSLTGEGLDKLRTEIAAMLIPSGESAIVTNRRHIDELSFAADALDSAIMTYELDCIATDIRNAMLHVGAITGDTADEDVIDAVFSKFCVGK